MKIQQSHLTTIRWTILFSFLLVILATMYSVISFQSEQILLRFFNSALFPYITISLVFLYIAWQWSSNKLTKFPLTIAEPRQERKTHQSDTEPLANRKYSFGFINFMGILLLVPFLILILIQIWLAFLSGYGWVRVDFARYRELIPELILFNGIFVGVVYLIYRNFKHLREAR